MTLLEDLRTKIKYYPLYGLLIHSLTRIGIMIRPFQVMSCCLKRYEKIKPAFQSSEYTIQFADTLDVDELVKFRKTPGGKKSILQQFAMGNRCLVARLENTIIAAIWCEFNRCSFAGYQFSLKKNEVNAYEIFVDPVFRGNSIAAILMNKLYHNLKMEDYDFCYHIAIQYNRPSQHFMEKLQIQVVDSGILLGLVNNFFFSKPVNSNRLNRMRALLNSGNNEGCLK